MASFTFNSGSTGIANRSIDYIADTIKVLLLGNITPWTPDKDATNMTTIAASELSLTGYVAGFAGAGRKTLANKVISVDFANDHTMYDADDPSAWTLAAGDTVTGAIIYKHLTSDAASTPIFYHDTADTLTNGSTFTLTFAAFGVGYTQQ